MAEGQLNRIIQHLRRAVLRPDGGSVSDGQLLEDFILQRQEAAFEALIQRHGPMVMNVCQRILRNAHDAEDAFQATFLVLVRKAPAIGKRELVGNWLYGVAYRTALEAKVANARRRAKESLASMARPEPATNSASLDLQAVLDHELSRLPARFRVPVVLCDLEGKTQVEAAQLLGCPVGTIASRLARARAKLAKRFARRGLAVSSVALSLVSFPCGASASIAHPLIAATAKAAVLLAAGQSLAGGLVSANVAALVKGVLQSMFLTKVKIAMAVLLVAGFAVVGGAGLAYQTLAAEPTNEFGGKRRGDASVAQSDPEKLKQENERLRKELQQAKDEAEVLRAKLAAAGPEHQETFFQGKPASFWLKQLKDRDGTFRQKAVEALGELAQEDRALLPVVIDCLKDRTAIVRGQAVRSLEAMGSSALAAVPDVVGLLREGKVSLSERNAVSFSLVSSALKGIDPEGKSSVPLLVTLVKDKDEEIRIVAAFVLARVAVAPKTLEQIAKENKELVAIYVHCLQRDGYPLQQSEAASALAAVGPEAKTAVPALVDALKKNPFDFGGFGGGRGGQGMSRKNPFLEALQKIDPDAAAKMKAGNTPPE